MDLDTLIYDPKRLVCSEEEKETCLETVRKLVRLSQYIRREGILSASLLVENDNKSEAFFRTCLLEFEEHSNDPETLEQILHTYLVEGNYRGGAFLDAVLVVKGLLLLTEHLGANPSYCGELLSVGLRGFFGVEYRECVMKVVEDENAKYKRNVSHSRI